MILYCGDHDIDDAARYLAGSLRAAGLKFDYLPSNVHFPRATAEKKYQLYILSDYPSRFLGKAGAKRIADRVRDGAGLLMIGGWGSFTGVDGLYGRTALADALPVRCLAGDDRRQGAAAYRIAPGRNYGRFNFGGTIRNSQGISYCVPEIMPAFDLASAPTLAGYNKTLLKPGASEILRVETLRFNKANTRSTVIESAPLLVTRTFGRGRVTAFCTDLAPHWSGGLVDWGRKRLTLKAAPGVSAQVGSEFVRFAQTLVRLSFSGDCCEK